jgi:hypothetical protein
MNPEPANPARRRRYETILFTAEDAGYAEYMSMRLL